MLISKEFKNIFVICTFFVLEKDRKQNKGHARREVLVCFT